MRWGWRVRRILLLALVAWLAPACGGGGFTACDVPAAAAWAGSEAAPGLPGGLAIVEAVFEAEVLDGRVEREMPVYDVEITDLVWETRATEIRSEWNLPPRQAPTSGRVSVGGGLLEAGQRYVFFAADVSHLDVPFPFEWQTYLVLDPATQRVLTNDCAVVEDVARLLAPEESPEEDTLQALIEYVEEATALFLARRDGAPPPASTPRHDRLHPPSPPPSPRALHDP